MPYAGFEPAIPASERVQTHALVRAAIGIGHVFVSACYYLWINTFCLLGCDVIWYQILEVRPPETMESVYQTMRRHIPKLRKYSPT